MTVTTSIATIPKVGTYVIDPAHTEVGFIARHLIGTKVRGRFTEVSGTFTVAENPEESTLKASVEAASVDTNNSMRDDHLRTNDFLDVPNYPTLSLTSIGLKQVGKTVVAFSATAEIDRRDFGVSFNPSLLDGSVVVGNKVVIELEVEASLAD